MKNQNLQTLIRLLFLCLVIGSFITCTTTPPQKETSKQSEKPNIVFILADDLGYTDLSCMGSTYYETPNIDKIATQGMVFTNGYAACQVCSPSRASLMTGKTPLRHGITDWIGAPVGENWRKAKRFTKMLPPDYNHQLSQEDTTMPEVFQANGYHTFFAGKWHLGNEGSYPEDHGFDGNQGGYERGGPYTGGYFSPFNNPKMKDYPSEKGMSLSMKLAKETTKFITTNKDQPFFAYLSFYAVHSPIQTSKGKWDKFRQKAEKQGIKSQGFEMERRLPYRLQQDNPVYAGLIEQMDDAVGHVLQTLEALNLDKNTIVVFTSDNGGVVSGDNFSTNLQPLRGGKGYQWEGGIRIPYLINVPWMKLNGQKTDIPSNGTDFFPTLLELAGLPLLPASHTDGVSLVPALKGNKMAERALFWHYPHYGNQGGDPSSIIRRGDWKLIQYHETDEIELYNLKEDLGEQRNVAQQHTEIVTSLKKELEQELSTQNVRYPSADPQYSQEAFDKKATYYSNEVKEKWEQQRKDFLNPDWQPNKDWWGSQGTID